MMFASRGAVSMLGDMNRPTPRRSIAFQAASRAIIKALGIIAALALPFFVVLVVGLIFDKKTGGDPFYATVAILVLFSPLWLLLGILLAVLGFRRDRVRRGVFIAHGVLLLLIIAMIAWAQAINAL
jgi:signal transduction histidine kinase